MLHRAGRADLVRPEARRATPRGVVLIDPATQNTHWGRPDPVRAATLSECALAGARCRPRCACRRKTSTAMHHLADRPVGRREVDDREPCRAPVARSGPPHLSARRGQCQARPKQRPRLHRLRPRGEHPPGRRGREVDGRRRTDRDRRFHLSVRKRTQMARAPSNPASSSRSMWTHRFTSLRNGTQRASTRRRGGEWPTSPASIRLMSRHEP